MFKSRFKKINFLKILKYCGPAAHLRIFFISLMNSISLLLEIITVASIALVISEFSGLSPGLFINIFEKLGVIEYFPEILSFPNKNLAAIIFLVLSFSSLSFKIFVLILTNYFGFYFGKRLGESLYRSILTGSESFIFNMRRSDIVSAVVIKSNSVIFGIILPIISLSSTLFLIVFSVLFVLVKAGIYGIISISFLLVFYGFFWVLIRGLIDQVSIKSARANDIFVSTVNQDLSGIKQVKIEGSEKDAIKSFGLVQSNLRNSQRVQAIISGFPKAIIESLVLIFLGMLFYYFALSSVTFESFSDVFLVFVLAGFRVMPLFSALFSSFSSVFGTIRMTEDILEILEQTDSGRRKTAHQLGGQRETDYGSILEIRMLQRISSYRDKSVVYPRFELQLSRGQAGLLVGPSGSGKSTLFDAICGFVTKFEGSIYLLGHRAKSPAELIKFRPFISYVPQDVFVRDVTLLDLICRGAVPDWQKLERLWELLDLSFLGDCKQCWMQSLGELGGSLSAGQRQRVALARALYASKPILLLDEATANLDGESERTILRNLIHFQTKEINGCVLAISHNLSLAKLFDAVFFLKNPDKNLEDV